MKVRLPYCGTNRTTPNNIQDTTIRDHKQGTCLFIDAGIPGDENVIKTEVEKILKYKDVIIEIQPMWNMKAKLV